MKLTKIVRKKGQSEPQENGGNVTLIHRMSYELKFFIDEVLQCLVDKYQITYQNI